MHMLRWGQAHVARRQNQDGADTRTSTTRGKVASTDDATNGATGSDAEVVYPASDIGATSVNGALA